MYLKATAGMRSIDPADQEKILNEVRSIFGDSGYHFSPSYAKVITG